MSAFTRLFLIVLVSSHILSCFSNNTPKEHFFLKILNNGQIVGILEEKIESRKGLIHYEKSIQYISGEFIRSKFTIAHDFSSFDGEITKKNGEKIIIKRGKAKIFRKRKTENYRVFPGVLPSSVVHLYIHELLREEKEVPDKITIFYENTGDIFEVEIKILNKERDNVEIHYFFDKINLSMHELFFIKKKVYFMFSPPVYLLDCRLEKELIPWIKKEVMKQSRDVAVYKSFRGFFNVTSLFYRLFFCGSFSIPQNNIQEIIEEGNNNSEHVILLKLRKMHKIVDSDKIERFRKYVLSLNHSTEINELTYKITRGETERQKKIEKILEWIKENIKPTDDGPFEPDLVLKHRKGDCQGISNLFLAMCSALNIFGRAVAGIVIFHQDEKYFYSFHQWVELWEEDYWIPYDPTFGFTGIGLNYIKLLNLEKRIDLLKMASALKCLKVEIIEEEQ